MKTGEERREGGGGERVGVVRGAYTPYRTLHKVQGHADDQCGSSSCLSAVSWAC